MRDTRERGLSPSLSGSGGIGEGSYSMGSVSTDRDGEDRGRFGGSANHLYKHTRDAGIAGSEADLRSDLSIQSTGDSGLALPIMRVGDPSPQGRLSFLGASGKRNKSGHFK